MHVHRYHDQLCSLLLMITAGALAPVARQGHAHGELTFEHSATNTRLEVQYISHVHLDVAMQHEKTARRRYLVHE